MKEALLISLGAIGTGEALEVLREHLGDPFYREAAAKAIAMVNSHEAAAILSRFLELPVEKIHRSFDVLAEIISAASRLDATAVFDVVSAMAEGIGINALVGGDPVPPSGGAAFHDSAIWIKPASFGENA